MPVTHAIWVLLAGCTPENLELAPIPGTKLAFDLEREAFYDAPFPSDDLQDRGLDGFPNPDGLSLIGGIVDLLDGFDGFALTAGVYFAADGPLGGPLPDVFVEDGSVFLVDVSPSSPEFLTRRPIDVQYAEWGGPFGARHQLSLLPLQGMPLQPRTSYAAVVLRKLGDESGRPLGVPGSLRELLADPASAPDSYGLAASALDQLVGLDEIAGLAAFTTGDPAADFASFAAHLDARQTPVPSAPEQIESYDDYCVYRAAVPVPIYQQGDPPYATEGGGWPATPEIQGEETARLLLSVPRTPMPQDGYPVMVMIRTGGGGDRPLIDRGVRDESGNVAIPGSGPAWTLAVEGVAGASMDGPHGGWRNITGGDEQFLMFNVNNPAALRDNVRQSALELLLLPEVLEKLRLDGDLCAGTGGGSLRFDTTRLGLLGHSMGATIAPLVLAHTDAFELGVLSGAGASYIMNVVHKQSPIAVRPLAEAMLGYADLGWSLTPHDPVLGLLQWAGEPADPPIYAPAVQAHLLVFQGIVDTYILPPIANPTSLSLGLDLGGAALDEDHPELAIYRSALEVLPLADRGQIALPASANREGRTLVLVQHAEDGVEDGHEVMFQLDAARVQLRCLVRSWVAGAPVVVDGQVGCGS